MKKILALLLAVLLLCALGACAGNSGSQTAQTASSSSLQQGNSDLAYVLGNKKMIIGYTVYEPMNYTDENGVFTGFDTELATLVCEKLGVTPEFVIINWDTKEVALEAKDIDCIWNGLTLNPSAVNSGNVYVGKKKKKKNKNKKEKTSDKKFSFDRKKEE